MERTTNQNRALQRAVEILGTQVALADAINANRGQLPKIRQGHIWQWLHRNKKAPPPEYCPVIEMVCDDPAVTCQKLRPDVYTTPTTSGVAAAGDRAI